MPLDLNECSQDCWDCVKRYKKKHELKKGGKFNVKCKGIPKHPVQLSLLESLPEEEQLTAQGIKDPVEWAKQNLDWHCFDPDGSVWARKNPDEYQQWILDHPGEDIFGRSRYHRPYQAEMLRCTAKQKVFRIGRQAGKTETLVVSMLYHMFTKPGITGDNGFKIVLITPFQTQIELVFDRLLELIRGNAQTANSISRSVKAPNYMLKLNNNSMIRGFTAGTKSGGNADPVRGQHANMLVFDEADYLSVGDMDSALSVITNSPSATMWMSSTPCGKREKFYETCHSNQFREFYFPSQVNPLWNEDLESLFKTQLTEIGYKHEILADFGEQEEGVFQYNYVKAAQEDYEYGDLPYNPQWTYAIGVDWNDVKNGSTVVVVGFDPYKKKFTLVDRKTVSRDGWNQLAACEKIAELNRLWNPIVIMIDYGHGGTQYEILRKFGYDSMIDPGKGRNHPDARLARIVKQYNFSSKVTTRDLFTKAPVDKPAKPFLVESTVRRFEAHDFIYPESDELLTRQLLGYVIDRVTPTGQPVYKANDEQAGDHILDGLMLAIMGFVLEVSPLGKPKYDSRISFSGQFGEAREHLENWDTPQKPDPTQPKEKPPIHQTRAEQSRPEMGRSTLMEQRNLFPTTDLPANNIDRSGHVKLWSWDGFLRDEPRPRVRTVTQSAEEARKRVGIGRPSCRPRRKNI